MAEMEGNNAQSANLEVYSLNLRIEITILTPNLAVTNSMLFTPNKPKDRQWAPLLWS